MINSLSRYRRYLLGSFWTELRYRYAGTTVGFFWFFVNPLLEVLVYTVVFSYVINLRTGGQRPSDYVIFLCTGLFPWLAFVENLNKGATVLIANRLYLNRLAMPPAVFVAKNSLLSYFTLLIYSVILIPVVLLFGNRLNWTLLLIPVIGFLFQLMGMGISLTLSHLHTLIPDVGEILNPILQLWRWTLPILFKDDIFPEFVRPLLRWNPPYYFITSFREILTEQSVPSATAWGFMVFWVILFSMAGIFTATKLYSDIKDSL
ncbi:MAG: ABC transporter permease [Chloroflexi bacterium]|nr:ABC transporter permease [Chloroflexota bacterium]